MAVGATAGGARPAEVGRSDWDIVLMVAAGGAVGSLARWWLEDRWPPRPGAVPWVTLWINVGGCALLGALLVCVRALRPASRYLRPALGTGVLGGFTTFSGAMAETRALVVGAAPLIATGYLVASVLLGLAAGWLGAKAGWLAVSAARGWGRAGAPGPRGAS